MSKYKTVIDGHGPNGNIFAILGNARHLMKQLGESKEEISKLTERVTECNSYEEALSVIREYFTVDVD